MRRELLASFACRHGGVGCARRITPGGLSWPQWHLGRLKQPLLDRNRLISRWPIGWLYQLPLGIEDTRGIHHSLNTCFSDTAFTYGVLQVMKPSERYGPEHFDGGASLLHGGLTIFGSRHLECKVAASAAGEEAWEVLPQRPGSFYVATLCVPGIVYDT